MILLAVIASSAIAYWISDSTWYDAFQEYRGAPSAVALVPLVGPIAMLLIWAAHGCPALRWSWWLRPFKGWLSITVEKTVTIDPSDPLGLNNALPGAIYPLQYQQFSALQVQQQAQQALSGMLLGGLGQQQLPQHIASSTFGSMQQLIQQHNAFIATQMVVRQQEPELDPDAPNTLGWRSWTWDPAARLLRSPSQWTPWPDAELRCEAWSSDESVRGCAGIHARLVPVDWKTATSSEVRPASGWHDRGDRAFTPPSVTGIVERFGKYVLGTEGWRAEWVIIRKLHAPTPELAEELRRIYPEVEISHADR